MSEKNTVNPRIYTQKGHLAPTEEAEELQRQREAAPPTHVEEKTPPSGSLTEKDKEDEDEGLTE